MNFTDSLHVILARQSILIVSLLQYGLIFYLLSPSEFFIFGVLTIVSLYCRNAFDAILQPSAINYSHDHTQSKFYRIHYIIVFAIAGVLSVDDLTLLVLSISVGFLQLYCNNYFTHFFVNAYISGKYYKLALCQSGADLLSTSAGFLLFFLTGDVYYLGVRFLMYPIILLIFCVIYLDGTSYATTNISQSKKSIMFLNIQHFVGFLGKSGDRLLIVSLMDPIVFALYDRAMSGMRVVYSALSQPLTPVILIQFKKIKDGGERNIVKYLSVFTAVIYLFGWVVFLCIDLLIPVIENILPPQWVGVVEYLRVLIWLIPVNLMIFNASSFFIALHREDLNLLSGVLSSISLIVAFAVGLLVGGMSSALMFLVFAMAINVCQVYTLLLFSYGSVVCLRFYLIPVIHVISFILIV